jgi:hypothetical protein
MLERLFLATFITLSLYFIVKLPRAAAQAVPTQQASLPAAIRFH